MIQRRNGHRSEREFEIIQMVHDMKMKDDFIMKMTGGWIEEGEEEQHEEGRREEWGKGKRGRRDEWKGGNSEEGKT